MLGKVKDISVKFSHFNEIPNEACKNKRNKLIGIRKNTVGVSKCEVFSIVKKDNEAFVFTVSGFAFRAKNDNFDKSKGKALAFKRAYQECPGLIQRAIKEKYDISKWKLKTETGKEKLNDWHWSNLWWVFNK